MPWNLGLGAAGIYVSPSEKKKSREAQLRSAKKCECPNVFLTWGT